MYVDLKKKIVSNQKYTTQAKLNNINLKQLFKYSVNFNTKF